MNRVILCGRLTRTPELKKTTSGISTASFGMAVERDYKDAGGSRPVDFLNCVAWRNTAEFLSRYFHKGDGILIEGRVETRSWQDQNGQKRTVVEINVEKAYFYGQRRSDADDAEEPAQAPAVKPQPQEQQQSLDGFYPVDDDEDIPF